MNGKWKDVFRVDTAKHGDINKEGLAHVHHFYKNKRQWYQLLSNKGGKDFILEYQHWFKDIKRRAKHHKRDYLYNK
jgi:hypothetical protein